MKKLTGIILSLTLTVSLLFPMHASAATNSTPANAPYDYSLVFDWEYYYNNYADLQQTIGKNEAALFEHFVTTGMKEGRNGSADFQLKAYMLNNLDLLPVYGAKDLSAYYIHYMTCGKSEGRVAIFNNGMTFPANSLAGFTTVYNTQEARAINVELAAAKINGMIIEPGQTFSFSDSVESRTLENGYVEAPSFASGKVVTSVGGGICQVSSTLYVTMLLSGIPATQHYFHSLPVTYVPTGLDAAIAEGTKDLRFVNPYSYPIVIEAVTNNGILTVNLKQAPL
ncbi:MAG: VanW family protein [Lachnospiraceae bacterium]|nr:VanW family protein [Lachnospiraceae bacterium]